MIKISEQTHQELSEANQIDCSVYIGLIGKKNLKLKAIEYLGGGKLKCVCDCGNYRVVGGGYFKSGLYKSCGCHFRKDPNEIHVEVTQQELKRLFNYDQETGVFTRKVKVNNFKAKEGCVAGSFVNKLRKQYWSISIRNKPYLCHRLAWLYVYGSLPKEEIDHIDGNGLNNSIGNLRCVSHQDNGKNVKLRKDNKSGVCGVAFDESNKRWFAQIRVDGKCVYLGRFIDKNDAIIARKAAEIKFNFHENHGRSYEQRN